MLQIIIKIMPMAIIVISLLDLDNKSMKKIIDNKLIFMPKNRNKVDASSIEVIIRVICLIIVYY